MSQDPNIIIMCGAEQRSHKQDIEEGDEGFLGKTIGFIRCAYKEELGIKPEFPALIRQGEDGQPQRADDSYVLKENDRLEFVWATKGEKGR